MGGPKNGGRGFLGKCKKVYFYSKLSKNAFGFIVSSSDNFENNDDTISL